MLRRFGHVLSERRAAVLALALPVVASIGWFALHSAPGHYLAIQAAALALGIPLVQALHAPERLASIRILLVLGLALLAAPLVTGPAVNGIARWLPLGPLTLHAGMLVLPGYACLAARDTEFRAIWLTLAALVAVRQPDAAVAFAATGAAAGLYMAGGDWRDGLATVACFFAGLAASLRGELPAQPFVERVLVDLALTAPVFAAGLAASLLASYFLIVHGLPRPKPERFALAGTLFGFSMMGILANHPAPLIGFGAAPVLGYGLALGLERTRRL